MTITELKALAELNCKAHEENGVSNIDCFTGDILLNKKAFDGAFEMPTSIERYEFEDGVFYRKNKKVDGAVFYCYVDEADMTAKDKEDAEWFGVLPK